MNITDAIALAEENTLTTPNRESAVEYVGALLETGLKPIPLKPDSKEPAIPAWPTAAVSKEAWDGWLDAAYAAAEGDGIPALGVGIRLTAMRMIAVDFDTPEARASWNAFAPMVNMPTADVGTVASPGTEDRRHHDGGHLYIQISAALPLALNKVYVGPDGVQDHGGDDVADIMLHGCFICAPGTHRNGGVYAVAGEVVEASPEFIQFLTEEGAKAAESKEKAAQRRAERKAARAAAPADWQTTFEDENTWADLLTPLGWRMVAEDPRCGCEEWLRPGSSAAKSATAHDCDSLRLHVWTSNAGYGLAAGQSYSKIQVAAAVRFGSPEGEALGKAMEAAGKPDSRSAAFDLQARVQSIMADRSGAAETTEETTVTTTPAALQFTPFQSDAAPAAEGMKDTEPATAGHPDPGQFVNPELWPAGHPAEPQLAHRVFDFNNATRAIYAEARASKVTYVSPAGLLFSELVRTAQAAGPDVRTDTGDGLGLFVALVGPSGGGKSVIVAKHVSAEPVIKHAVRFQGDGRGAIDRGRGSIIPGAASGPALVKEFLEELWVTDTEAAAQQAAETIAAGGEVAGKRGGKELKEPKTPMKKITQLRSPAVVTITEDELSTLAAKAGHDGSTLGGTLLNMWSEGAVGDVAKTDGGQVITPEMGHYQLNLLGGIQPGNSAVAELFGAQATHAGLAQRLLPIALEDPWFDFDLDTGEVHDWAGVGAPTVAGELPEIPQQGTFELPPSAKREAMANALATARGTSAREGEERDPVQAHAHRSRMRVATVAALLFGERGISEEIWEWAAAVMEMVNRSRAHVAAAAKVSSRSAAVEAAAERKTAERVGEAESNARQAKIVAEVLAKIPAEGIGEGALINAFSKGRKAEITEAVEHIATQKMAMVQITQRGKRRFSPALAVA